MRTQGWPCLDISPDANGWGTYIDRLGRHWNVSTFEFHPVDTPDSAFEFRGTYSAIADLGGVSLALSGGAYLCGDLVQPLRPCH